MSRRRPEKTLIGRTIVAVEMRPFRCEGDDRDSFNPQLVLDDGSTLSFSVQENECGDQYGVVPLHYNRPKKKKKKGGRP